MTATTAKRVAASFATFGAKAKAVRADAEGDIWRITLPIQDHAGQDFRVYVYHPITGTKPFVSKKIVLTDGGSITRHIRTLGNLQLKAIQSLVSSFGVSLMEDMTVMERSDRSMPMRMMSYLQAWCAVDGMLRIWDVTKKEVADVRSTERHRGVDEDLRSGS